MPFMIASGFGVINFYTPFTNTYYYLYTFMEKFISFIFIGHVDFKKCTFKLIISVFK